jgi:hypothetical protein
MIATAKSKQASSRVRAGLARNARAPTVWSAELGTEAPCLD